MYTTYYEYDDHLCLQLHILSKTNGILKECFLYNDLRQPLEYIEKELSNDEIKRLKNHYNLKEISIERAEHVLKYRFLYEIKNRIINIKQEMLNLEKRKLEIENWYIEK